MPEPPNREERLPLAEERIAVHKRTVERGRVRIRTVVEESTRWVRESLASESVHIERVTVEREVETVPPIRQEGDTLIIPVVEEFLVIERRLLLKEEVHVRKEHHLERIEEPVKIKSTRAIVERDMRQPGPEADDPKHQGGSYDDTNPDGTV